MRLTHLTNLLVLALTPMLLSVAATFDVLSGTTLRICLCNVMQKRPEPGKSRDDSFVCMLNRFKADIWMLQEMFYSDNPSTSDFDAFWASAFTAHRAP